MKKMLRFTLGLLFFAVILGLSVWKESTLLLYIASAIPMLIVPLLPDFGSNQFINPSKHSGQVEIVRAVGETGATGLLLIRFRPGYLRWNKKMLYFSLNDLSSYSTLPIPGDLTASLSVLKYDLKRHHRRKNMIGIRLSNVKARTQHLSVTLNEINRLVINIEDIRDLIQPNTSSSASRNKSLQA